MRPNHRRCAVGWALAAGLAVATPKAASAGRVWMDGIGCHAIAVAGPSDRIARYRVAQEGKFEPVDEAVVVSLGAAVELMAWPQYEDFPHCAQAVERPKKIILTEKGKREAIVLSVDLEAKPIKVSNRAGFSSTVYSGTAELSLENFSTLKDRELDAYVVTEEAGHGPAKWRKDYAAKVLKPGK